MKILRSLFISISVLPLRTMLIRLRFQVRLDLLRLRILTGFYPLHTGKIEYPPGMYVSKVLGFLFSKKVQERVFDSILADMQEEYFEALDKGYKWKMRWIHIRGIICVLTTVMSQLPVSLVKIVTEIWKVS